MSVSRRRFLSSVTGFAMLCLSGIAGAQRTDQMAAARVLGPQWEEHARAAGMIFAGTVLASPASSSRIDRTTDQIPFRTTASTIPTVALRFRVDHPIAGVAPGQIVTIHEWTGAGNMRRSVSIGEHLLILLYPPSRLGLTSPVGGSLGQIALDSSGKNVAAVSLTRQLAGHEHPSDWNSNVSVLQLARAIRNARGE